MICPLCNNQQTEFFFEDKFRTYYQCRNCSLIFVPDEFLPGAEKELERYNEHENDPGDERYKNFLRRIVDPVLEYVPKGSSGLDFGCGPAPVLADMLSEAGYLMQVYDPFYANKKEVLAITYDFVVSTEVVEHFHKPYAEFGNLFGLLKPGGILAIMTLRYHSGIFFKGWHYKNDLTHVCFFTDDTFKWLANHFDAEYSFYDKDIVLIRPNR